MAIIFEMKMKHPEQIAPRLHDALKGWDPYVNSDVLLNVDSENQKILLVVGQDNDKNIDIELRDFGVKSNGVSAQFEIAMSFMEFVKQVEESDKATAELENIYENYYIVPKDKTDVIENYDIEGNKLINFSTVIPVEELMEDPDYVPGQLTIDDVDEEDDE